MARSMATCHPDRPVHGHELCRLCYREQRKANRAATRAAAPTTEPASSPSPLTPPKPAPKPSASGKAKPKAEAKSAAPKARRTTARERLASAAPGAQPDLTVIRGEEADVADAPTGTNPFVPATAGDAA